MTKEEKEAVENLESLSEYGLCYTITEEIQENLKTLLNLIQTQQAEIEKKDKIIDEMANYIRVITVDMKIPIGENLLWDKEEIKQYFERKIENV